MKFKIISLLLFVFSFYSYAATEDKVNNYISDLTASVDNIFNDKALSNIDKMKKLEAVFFDHVDVDWIGKFALGRSWNNLSDEQKNKYLATYRQYLSSIYIPNFEKYTINSLKINKVVKTNPNEYLIQTEITDDSGINIHVNYRVLNKNGKYKIFDIVAEGVSLITTQRSEFNSILSNSGIDNLLSKMQNSIDKKSQ